MTKDASQDILLKLCLADTDVTASCQCVATLIASLVRFLIVSKNFSPLTVYEKLVFCWLLHEFVYALLIKP